MVKLGASIFARQAPRLVPQRGLFPFFRHLRKQGSWIGRLPGRKLESCSKAKGCRKPGLGWPIIILSTSA